MRKFLTRLGYSFAILIISTAGTAAYAVIVPTCPKEEATAFSATGSLQTYHVPGEASTILIEAFGASGGNVQGGEFGAHSGGLGGAVTAEVPVTPGSTLDVVVGQEGESPSSDGEPAGGGGATAISVGGVPLVVAGGGGGAGVSEDGDNAQLGEDGSDGEGVYGGSGGTNGNGGSAATYAGAVGGGGGGWLTAGETSSQSGSGGGGHALSGDAAGGAAGAATGGYGGGGGSAGVSGGGGGGYGGGGTGEDTGPGYDGGGGGGSFAAADAVQSYNLLSGNQGDGGVSICVGPNSVPTAPWATLVLLALGLLTLGALALRRKTA